MAAVLFDGAGSPASGCPGLAGRASSVPAEDGFAALVAVPARFRELLDRYGSLDQLDVALRHRRAPGEWSALELIAHVADSLHASARCAVALRDGEHDRRSRPLHIDAPRAGVNGAPTRAVLGSLQAAAVDLARALNVAPLVIDASAPCSDHSSSALEARALLDRALHESEGHLAGVETLLDAVATPSSAAAAWQGSTATANGVAG